METVCCHRVSSDCSWFSASVFICNLLIFAYIEYIALTINGYFVALFTAYFARDGFSQDFWNESGRTEKLFTTPWIMDIRKSRFVTPKLVPVPGVRGSSKWCIAYRSITISQIELKFVADSYFKQLFQNLRPKLKYSKNRIL